MEVSKILVSNPTSTHSPEDGVDVVDQSELHQALPNRHRLLSRPGNIRSAHPVHGLAPHKSLLENSRTIVAVLKRQIATRAGKIFLHNPSSFL